MEAPKVGLFVKVVAGAVWFTTLRLYADGSCGFLVPAPDSGLFEGYGLKRGGDVWRAALRRLAELGFVEVGEARDRGLVPPGWERPPCSPGFGIA